MGLEILLPLILPIVTPILTELVKKAVGWMVNDIPANAVRSIAVASGGIITAGFQAAGVDLFGGMGLHDPEQAIAAGAALGGGGGIALHTLFRKVGITDKKELATGRKKVLAWLLLPLALSLTACAELKDMASKAETIKQEFCKIGPLIISAMETASLAAEAKGDGALAVKIKDARAILLRYGPTVCPAPRTPTDATPASLPALDPRDSLSTSVICNPRLARDG